MTESDPPQMTGIAHLQQQAAALQAGQATEEDLMRFQAELQKWQAANQLQSQMLHEMSETLKGIIQKM
jgi:hypothetical protein